MTPEFEKALTKARLDLLRHPKAVFVSTLVLMMKTKVDNTQPTAATDGLAIYYNEDFFLKLPRPQRMTLLAHEAMHPALQHLGRLTAGIDPQRWNRAGDYVINLFLLDAGMAPIDNWLCDKKYAGLSTRQVYDLLQEEDEAGGGSGPSHMEDLMPPGASEPEMSKEASEQQIVSNIQAANIAVEMRKSQGADPGSVPADVLVFLESLLKPKLPMAYHLRKFFRALDKSDYSWRKPNKRFMPMILPGLSGHNKLLNIDFAFDMSCSVRDSDTRRYLSEMHGVMKQFRPDQLNLVQFDTSIKSVTRIKSLKDMAALELKGRGGTCIECVMEHAKKTKPKALVVFTDGMYDHPSFDPKVPVLWLVHGPYREHFRCDFGTIIKFDVEDLENE